MQDIWTRSYPAGVPAHIDPSQFASVVELFEESCRKYADRTAYISMGARLAYADLDRLSRDFAAWLQAAGLGKGARVALMMPNVLQYPVCLFGILRAGCVAVNCNPLYTPRELEFQLQDSGAEAIVIVENFAHTLDPVLARTSVRHVVVTALGDMLGPLKGPLVNFVVRHVKKMVPAWTLRGAIPLKRALAHGEDAPFHPMALGHQDIAFLQYTGGTTGVAKGAILTHGNIVANVLQACAWIAPAVNPEGELIVTALPLYHVFALTANCLTFIRIGAANLLIVNARDIPGFIKELRKNRVTALTGVNTLFNALLNHPEFTTVDFSTLKLVLAGGMALQKVVADRWQEVTGCVIVEAYGLTETSPAVAINPTNITAFTGAIGLPVPSTDVSIRDDAGQELPLGEVGELCVRGPQVTQGYWQRPDETAKVFYPDGFLRTGDLGYINEGGYIHLVDRKKDMILVSGFKVYPNEVEAVVATHPGVREVAAIGVPDKHSGELVKIFVVRKDPKLTAEELIAHCRTELTGYKVPHSVEFRDELPHTNVGKILRRALREETSET